MFIDDYFCCSYLYLLHKKAQALDIFKSFQAEVENQRGKTMKTILSVCDGELYSRYDRSGEQHLGSLTQRLEECGIILQYTMPSCSGMNVWLRGGIEPLKIW